MEVIYKVKCDLNKNLILPDLEMVQGDSCTRVIELSLYADDAKWPIPSGCTAAVGFGKPSGKNGLYDQLPDGASAVTVSDNVIRAILAEEVLTEAGRVKLLIVLNDADLNQLSTFPLNLRVAANPAAGEIVSNSYYKYTTMGAVSEAVDAWLTETAEKQDAFLEAGAEALETIKEVVNDGEDAPPIICSGTGAVIAVKDASDRLLRGLKIFGKTTQDGTPSPENPVELVNVGDGGSVKIKMTGANLIPGPYNLERSGVTAVVADDGTITYSGTSTSGFQHTFIDEVLPAGTYYVTWNKREFSGGSLLAYNYTTKQYLFKNTDGAFVSNGKDNIIVYVNSGSGAVYGGSIRPMLNVGEIALPYESYKEPQTLLASTPNGLPGIPVSSGGNWTDADGQQWASEVRNYGTGEIDHRAIIAVLDGTENWIQYSAGTYYLKFNGRVNGRSNILCSHFKLDNVSTLTESGTMIGSATSGYIYFCYPSTETLDEWKAWLAAQYEAGTPVEVLYQAEGVTSTIPAEELAAFAALRSNKPNTTIYNDAGAYMEADYVADTKTYIDNQFAALSAALVNNI